MSEEKKKKPTKSLYFISIRYRSARAAAPEALYLYPH